MMEIKISGATPQELYVNLHNIFLLVAKGGMSLHPVATAAEPSIEVTPAGIEALNNAPPAPKPRGRPRKPPADIVQPTNAQLELEAAVEEAKSEPQKSITPEEAPPEDAEAGQLTKFEILNDPVEANPVLTPECMLQRAKDIVSAHEKRGHTMQEGVAYLRKLYEGFGIKRVTELSPEQYGEFYVKAKPYLEGTAE